MRKLILFCLLLFPVLAGAQSAWPLFTYDSILTKGRVRFVRDNWKFHPGDNLQWAEKDFNDSAWKRTDTYLDVEYFKDKKIGFEGQGWFRYHFTTDSSLDNIPVAFSIDQRGASEIYIDGKLIYKAGRFSKGDPKGREYFHPRGFAVCLLHGAGHHVIAVRYENYNAALNYRRLGEDMGGFVLTLGMPNYLQADDQGNMFISAIFMVSSAGIFLALFLAHLILYLFYRQVKSNLIFSIFNLGFALLFFDIYASLSNDIVAFEFFLTPMVNVALCISCFALSALVNNLFSKRGLPFVYIAIFCLLTAVASFIHYIYATYMLVGLSVTCGVQAVISVILAMRRRVRGARILGVGILFLFLFITVIFLIALIKGGLQLNGGIGALLVALLALLALFSIPLSMSAYLAWTYASLNRDLKEQLNKVEALSVHALEQEQEKQRLLENRKEELETEVAHRTSEVLQQKDQIEQQHNALKAEKNKSDNLLLNILPAEVADELKESGYSKARHFDHVSVLFTDFVNFTQIAEQLSPEVLVQQLHECFRVFDDIMSRYGLEKIKTIGDAYLAVSGLPQSHPDHARNAVAAAIEIIDFVQKRNSLTTPFEIRIGINSGPLVAGIVGVKKFAYDIWGDTVNTASRMESNSLPGRINISATTYQLVKDYFACTHRGKISAKNKGAIDMYFVDHVITSAQ